MRSSKYIVATAEVLLIFPALLFMAALFFRNVQPTQYDPAHTAAQIVTWYAGQPVVGLWIFLMLLPFTVLVTGCATLLQSWKGDLELQKAARNTLATLRLHFATTLVAIATLAAGGVLAIVALHVLTD